jgi:hypothetical protein
MEQPEYASFAEYQAAHRKLDYHALMKFLSIGDINSAKMLCQLNCFKPDLPDLLVGTGRLTVEDLDDLLVVRDTTGLNDLPLGTFFVYSGCLTSEELRAFLLLQKTLRISPQRTKRWGQKLVEVGLLTEEQLQNALSDRIASSITLRQAILNRGWLSEDELDKIF